MSLYCRIENGEIISEPAPLPESIRINDKFFVNLYLASQETLNDLGFRICDHIENENYDSSYQTRTGPAAKWDGDELVAEYTVAGRDINEIRIEKYLACESALHEYIYATHPLASQATIMAERIKAKDADRADIVIACDLVKTWVDSCLDYFYSKVGIDPSDPNDIPGEIWRSDDPATVASVTWDFSEDCPYLEGLKSLSQIRKMWLSE